MGKAGLTDAGVLLGMPVAAFGLVGAGGAAEGVACLM